MDIIELYKNILSVGGLVVDSEGNVSGSDKGRTMPFTVDGKRLVLPTREHLKNPDWSNRVAFHPLCEDIMSPESPVLGRFRRAINMRLNKTIGFLMMELLDIALNTEMHGSLTPDQANMLVSVKNVDKDTLKTLTSIVEKIIRNDGEKCFVHLFIKKGGTVGLKKYSRATIVTFPFYNELMKKEKQIYDITVRTRDREVFAGLLEYIIPDIGTDKFFDTGSLTDIAPSLDSLMRALTKIVSRTNIVVNDFKNILKDDTDEYNYNGEWISAFDNLDNYEKDIRMIPMQTGNSSHQSSQATAPVYAVAPPQINAPPVTNYPIFQQVPKEVEFKKDDQTITNRGGLDFASLIKSNTPQQGYNTYQPMSGPMALRINQQMPMQNRQFGGFGNI